jgi:sugar phosphate isomerase/epimerase
MHPDTIEDAAPYRLLGRKLVLENMDARKRGGRTAAELAPYFAALPQAGFCFDVAHVASVDPTLAEGERLLDRFGARLRHVHVSSLDEECHHVPLTAADEERFTRLLRRCRDVPWILEAPLREL